MNEPLGGPEPQVWDVAAALLNQAPLDRRAAISPLIAMIGGVVAGGELHRADRSVIPIPPVRRRDESAGLPGRWRMTGRAERQEGAEARRVRGSRTFTENSLDSSAGTA